MMTKNDKKALKILLLISGIICILAVVLPRLGRIPNETIIDQRKRELVKWHDLTVRFLNSGVERPFTLYNIYIYGIENNLKMPGKVVTIYPEDELTKKQRKEIIEDRNMFNELVQYELIQKADGWIIKEKHHGFLYRKGLFCINQNAEIHEIKL